jgi:hypothetical protein
MIETACRHSQESVPVLDRDSPLPRLQELAQLGFWPRYPLHNIAEMTTRPFRISERSSGWVGVVRIAVAVFDCDIQNTQFVVGAEKTAEDDKPQPSAVCWIGIILLNPGKQSDQRVLRRLPPDFTGRESTNQFLSFIRVLYP